MKEITATDAARKFSDLLDDLERGGSDYVIVRRGKAVAHLEPIVTGAGKSVKALLALPVDTSWRSDLAALRDGLETENRY